MLWSVYLNWMGLKTLQGMPGDKAGWAILIAVILPLLVAIVAAAAFFTMLAAVMPIDYMSMMS